MFPLNLSRPTICEIVLKMTADLHEILMLFKRNVEQETIAGLFFTNVPASGELKATLKLRLAVKRLFCNHGEFNAGFVLEVLHDAFKLLVFLRGEFLCEVVDKAHRLR